jgi:uncharacterized protein
MSALIELRVDGNPTHRKVRDASTLGARLQGAFLTRELTNDPCGLWLSSCRWGMAFGMRFSVDVVFLRADGVVLKIVPRMLPWGIAHCAGAASVLKLRAGLARRMGLVPGRGVDLMAR